MDNTAPQKKANKEFVRFLKTLNKSSSPVKFRLSSEHFTLVLDEKCINFKKTLVDDCLRQKHVTLKNGRIALTDEGKALLIKLLHPDEDYALQHFKVAEKTIIKDGQRTKVTINEYESPLSRLFHRKSKNGEAWLNEEEFNAGERLRSDFEKAQLQPRISANWEASVASRNRVSNSDADISDFAVDARRRVERSIDAMGPELSGVVLDVCCFLKGLESIEKERAWPPRSAKLMLRTGLRELVRHYGIRTNSISLGSRHWGADGYRPSTLI